MSTRPFDQPLTPIQERLECYLDGLLTGDDKAAFEAEVAGNAELQAQIEAHRGLCTKLNAFASLSPSAPRTLPFASPAARKPRRWLKVAAIAACVGIPAAGAIFWYLAPPPVQPIKFTPLTSEQYQQKHRDLMLAEYKAQVASGFKPKEVCNTDEQFVDWTTKKLGHGLKPVHTSNPGDPAEPVLAGWSVGTTFSAYTGLLLAHVDGKPVMVVMDQAPPERMVPKDDPTGMPRMFRRNVNGVWMIEITPLDQPRVISRIEAAGE